MPLILNIETSTDICSICLSKGKEIISIKEAEQQYVHAARITILVGECLAEAGIKIEELSAVAVSSGPGSYTGLRIGTATAKGICYALGKPMIAVDTLRALAMACQQEEQKEVLYCPMIDARRMEVYTALFNAKNERITDTEALIIETNTFSEYLKDHSIIICGNGAEKCKQVLACEKVSYSTVVCSAGHLAPLAEKAYNEGRFCDVAYYAPLYFKAPNITRPRKIL